MKPLILTVLFLIFSGISVFAAEEIMFEGYYRVTASGKPIGYTIQRYTFDSTKKQFTSKYYVHAKSPVGMVTESLTAVSNDQFQPLSYQYTSQVGTQLKSIDAKFEQTKTGQVMSYTVANGQQRQTLQQTLSKDVFLSTFQTYLMLQKGFNPGTKFDFEAISEEDGQVQKGQALIKQEPGFEDKGILRILSRFKNIESVANANIKGEVIIVESPVQKIKQVLTPVAADATKGFNFNTKTIRYVFGNIPTGQVNQMAMNKSQPEPANNSASAQPSEQESAAPMNNIKINPPKAGQQAQGN
ncbi:MAG: hypothetical protein R2827_01130 [Bdellovibrionales bacterium]